jgi:hypothetical protein
MKTKITLEQKERAGALTLREFYSLTREQSNSYILQLFEVPVEQRTGIDKHILKYYSLKPALVIEEFFIDF